jgi:hypothetical protein
VTGFAVRMTNPCGMHLRTEVPAPWRSGDPVGGKSVRFRYRLVMHGHASP